jgi:hypothetical protein
VRFAASVPPVGWPTPDGARAIEGVREVSPISGGTQLTATSVSSFAFGAARAIKSSDLAAFSRVGACMRGLAILALAVLPASAHADELAAVDVVSAISRAVAKLDPKAPAGEPIEVATIAPSKDVPADAKLVRNAIAAAHYHVLLDVAEGRAMIAIDVENARAIIVLDRDGGSVAITPSPSSISAPGKCVAIPNVTHEIRRRSMGIGQDGEPQESDTRLNAATHHAFDIDGDGIPDVLVPAAATAGECFEQLHWRVFLVRGACGHELGAVGPGWVTVDGARDASGFHPLVAGTNSTGTDAQGNRESTTRTTRFAVRHGAYVKVDSSARTGACPHCASWWCSAP